MCGVFGFLDSKRQLTPKQKNRLLQVLANESEVRGTDACGIAYNHYGKLTIYKRPLPAHKLHLTVPGNVSAVLGHTRLTTQGDAKNNHNNHPFYGIAGSVKFAFAHNGVIFNDTKLRKDEALPKTKIETDSYVAIQLIENEKALSFDSLKRTAEKTQGTFVYMILDEHDNLWFVKGDNPITLYRFDNGLFVYASTKPILHRTLKRISWNCGSFTEIKLRDGDIIRIASNGEIDTAVFTSSMQFSYSDMFLEDNFDYEFVYTRSRIERRRENRLCNEIIDCVKSMGMSEVEIALLLDAGYSAVDIGDLIYDPELLHECLNEILCDY